MCTWYYAESKSLSFFIEMAQRLPLAYSIINAMVKPAKMSGNIRPTDMAAVIAPNKNGNMSVYPMIWGFTHESFKRPL